MSQHINHRREGKRHQDNGPRWENRNPMAGCNSTHVARARRGWRDLFRRKCRRKAKQMFTEDDKEDPEITCPTWARSSAGRAVV